MTDAGLFTPDQVQSRDDRTRNTAFDTDMRDFARRYDELLDNKSLSIEDYTKKRDELEREEAKHLREYWKDAAHPERWAGLNENQRAEVDARLKYHDYRDETRGIVEAYDKNPNDPVAKEAFLKRHNEFKELREEIAKSPQFKDDPHVKKMAAMEGDLQKAIDSGDVAGRKKIQAEMATEWREFNREHRTPEGQKQIMEFVEAHRDPNSKGYKVLHDSGMIDLVQVERQKRQQMGLDQPQQAVAPGGPAAAPNAPAQPAVKPTSKDYVIAATMALQEQLEKSPEFKDNAHVKQMATLRQEYAAATDPAKRAEAFGKMKEEWKQFAADVAKDPQQVEKLAALSVSSGAQKAFTDVALKVAQSPEFADNVHAQRLKAIEEELKKPGADKAKLEEEKKKEILGLADDVRTPEGMKKLEQIAAREALQTQQQTPNQAPAAGNVVRTFKDKDNRTVEVDQDGVAKYGKGDKDEGKAVAAKTEITATVDDGKGTKTTEKYVVSDQGKLAAPTMTPAGDGQAAGGGRSQ